uniref:Importin subunit alpha-4-like isoform X2 n=1 Tax=Cicer arietinum TaxID=3827 RepID=A0A3Q7XZX2_CICAR|nr:importin subunit alpha-4-like isoform X2 [Cicer arietinum]
MTFTLNPERLQLLDTWSCQRKNKRKDSRVVDVEDDLIQIRTNKHQEVLFKKLKEVHTRSDNTSSPIISDAVDATATALPVINTTKDIIPAMTRALCSNDPAARLEAITQFSKLLSMCMNAIHTLNVLAMDDIPQLQAMAASAFDTRTIMEDGVVPLLVQLLSSSSDDLKEMAVLALSNLVGDSTSTRDCVLNHGALLPLLSLLSNPSTTKLSMLKNATWTLLKLCHGKPSPPPTLFEQIQPTLSIFRELLWMPDEEVVQNACLTLSFLVREGSSKMFQAINEANICPKLVGLLLFPRSRVIVYVLQTLGDIVAGDEASTQILINNGVLPCLNKILVTQSDKIILKLACLVISNITAGTESQIQDVIDFHLVGPLVRLTEAEFHIKEAVWAIANGTDGTREQIRSFVSEGCIEALYDLLTDPDPTIVTVCLKGLKNILSAGEINEQQGLYCGVNIYAQMVDECGGLANILILHSDDNNDIYDRIAETFMKYWPLELEKDYHNLHSCVAGSDQDFFFGLNLLSDVAHSIHESTPSQPPSKPYVKVSQMDFLFQFPDHIQPYINNIVDVEADGNCGYRAIAALIGGSKDDWPLVRDELDKELGLHLDLYERLFRGRLQELRSSLRVCGKEFVGMNKWMSIPDMGYVIATTYKLILVSLSNTLSRTFFPLRGSPPPNQSTRHVICIGFVDGNHWVQVFLKAECPLPIIADKWEEFCYPEARPWPTAYIPQMLQWMITDPPKPKIKSHASGITLKF